MSVSVVGAASRIERQFGDGVEPVIRQVVRSALDAAGLSLAEIEMVVTVASDTLDGMMVPIRAELAGALGKTYLNVSSSAGHALAAAVVAIEAGDADTVLVVGWGAASKLALADSRANQFDPFYTRPLGASPRVVAALQKQVLLASGALNADDIAAFGERMAGLCWGGAEAPAAGFCDGVAALVLRRVSGQEGGLVVTDHAAASRSHSPEDGGFDPADWVAETLAGFSATRPAATQGFVEISGPTFWAEQRAAAAGCGAGLVTCEAAFVNGQGGGAAAWFGPATGLRSLAALCAVGQGGPTEGDTGLFIDLAGPLGQHVTGFLIERRRAA